MSSMVNFHFIFETLKLHLRIAGLGAAKTANFGLPTNQTDKTFEQPLKHILYYLSPAKQMQR